MARLSDREIKAALSKGIGKGGGAAVVVTAGVPTGKANQGDIAYDTMDGQIYVFNNGAYAATVNKTFLMYASNVNFTGESSSNKQAGKVTSQGDVTGFSNLPFNTAGGQLSWRGVFYGPTSSTDSTDYFWTDTKGDQGNQGRYQVQIYQDVTTKPATPTGGSFADETLIAPTGWTTTFPDPVVNKVWESFAVVNPEANASTVSEVTEIVTNGTTGNTTPVPGVIEQGFFDITGVPGTDVLGVKQSATLSFAGTTGVYSDTNNAEVGEIVGGGTVSGSDAGSLPGAAEKTTSTHTGVSGDNQIPAVPGVQSVWEVQFTDPNSDGIFTIVDNSTFTGFLTFTSATPSAAIRTYVQEKTNTTFGIGTATNAFNGSSSTDLVLGAEAGTYTIQEVRDGWIAAMNDTNLISSCVAKSGTTDTMVVTFKGTGNSLVSKSSSNSDLHFNITQITTGSSPVGGDGVKGSWRFDFGGSWTSTDDANTDNYFTLIAGPGEKRFNGGWSGQGEIASGTGYTTAGTYNATQVATFFTEGLNSNSTWTEYNAVRSGTSVTVTHNLEVASSISLSADDNNLGSGTLTITPLDVGAQPTGTGVYGSLTGFVVTLPTAHAATPITGSFTRTSDGISQAAQIRAAINAATTTNLTVEVGTTNQAVFESSVVGAQDNVTMVLSGGTNSTAGVTVVETVTGTDAVVRLKTAYTITGSMSNHTPYTVSATLPNGSTLAEALVQWRSHFTNGDLGQYTPGSIVDSKFSVTSTVTASETPNLSATITEVGTGGNLTLTANTLTEGGVTRTGTASSGTINSADGSYTLEFASGITDIAQATAFKTYVESQSSFWTITRVSNQLVFTSVLEQPGEAITTSWNVAGTATAPNVNTHQLGVTPLLTQDSIVLDFNGSNKVTHEFVSGRTLAQTVSSITELPLSGVILVHDDNFATGTTTLTSGYARLKFTYGTIGVVTDNTSSSVSITSGNANGHSLVVTSPTTTRQGAAVGSSGSLTPYTITINIAHSSAPLTGFIPSGLDDDAQATFLAGLINPLPQVVASASDNKITQIQDPGVRTGITSISYGSTGTNQTAVSPTSVILREGSGVVAGIGNWSPAFEPGSNGPPGTNGTNGDDAVQVQIQAVSGSQAMRSNIGSVTWKAFLIVGQTFSSDLGQVGSNVNSYKWYVTPTGMAKTLVTNGNVEALTGTTTNNNNKGSGDSNPFPYNSITIEADGSALGTTKAGSAGVECVIDYTI